MKLYKLLALPVIAAATAGCGQNYKASYGLPPELKELDIDNNGSITLSEARQYKGYVAYYVNSPETGGKTIPVPVSDEEILRRLDRCIFWYSPGRSLSDPERQKAYRAVLNNLIVEYKNETSKDFKAISDKK